VGRQFGERKVAAMRAVVRVFVSTDHDRRAVSSSPVERFPSRAAGASANCQSVSREIMARAREIVEAES